jgi:hypothetical protein
MTGRTCQLCGKALSRFTVGSGGDFCSREHRNQFRLRLGMDRLMEANKVANLMRRRENAKSIPAAQLARDSKVSPRVAPLLPMPMRQPDVRPMRPLAAALATPALATHSELSRLQSQPAKAMSSEVRSIEARDFGVRLERLLPPPVRSDSFQARIPPAGVVIPRLSGARLARLRREVSQLRLVLHRTHVGGNGIQVRPLHMPAQNPQEPQPARRLNNSAGRGRELRVSGGIGFRLFAPRIRTVEFPPPPTNPPGRSTNARGLTSSTQPKKSSPVQAGVMRFTVGIPSGPKGPKQNHKAAFQWPDKALNGTGPARDAIPVTRSCDVAWEAPPIATPHLRHGNGTARLRAVGPQAPSLPAPEPRVITVARRVTEIVFQPQETPFQCPSDLHGSLLSSMHFGAAPIRKVDAPPAAMEEHFDAGLQNWVGGTADWKVDVAGVRPGSLALYQPSLDMANYQLEFLTRIEQRGMSWVFRAANYQDYYKVTLAVAQGGGYEIRRQTMIGGLAENVTVRAVPPATPAHSGKTAVTVRTRVAGNDFTISLDGQAIDTWTDARLTAGGIGFVGAPEERARLYWVKVTPIGHISKEYSKR